MYVLSFNKDIVLVFKWWLEQVGKVINLMKQVPILPHVSLWDITIALAIINLMIYLIKFGYNFTVKLAKFDSSVAYFEDKDINNYNPKHIYQGKHSSGNTYSPKHIYRR